MSTAETNDKKARVAEHKWIDAGGNIVKTIEEATGISYRTLADPNAPAFVYQVPDDKARLMLALFGARTAATNAASANRNASAGSDITDLDAVNARFAALSAETWDDRERASGPRYNLDMLAHAVVAVYAASGKRAKLEKVRERLDDAVYYTGVIAVEAVKAEYARLKAVGAGEQALPDMGADDEDEGDAAEGGDVDAPNRRRGRGR